MSVLSRFYSWFKSPANGISFFQPKNVPKDSIVVNNVMVRSIQRQTQDISKWRMALLAAEGEFQQRQQLYDLYSDILLDGVLIAIVEKRLCVATNSPLAFFRNGDQVDEVNDLMDTSAFETFLKETLNSRLWGHSLMELHWEGPQKQTILIDRRHVKPRAKIVTVNPWDVSGVDYTQEPFSKRIIEVGGDEDLGRLLQCAPYCIFKRGNFGDWAEYAEVFGMPFRWATYNNEQSRLILEEALDKAGAAGYVVAPEDAKMEYFQGGGTQNSDIFRYLREACNQELTITVLGNTETTLSSTSSGYAQSATHMLSEEELARDDRKFILRVLNEKLNPYLQSIGYQVDGGKWSFVDEDGLTLKERIEIDLKVAEKVPIPDSYWYEKYHLPQPTEEEKKKSPPNGTKKDLRLIELQALYSFHDVDCAICKKENRNVQLADSDTFDVRFRPVDASIVQDFTNQIYTGNLKANDLHPALWNQYFSRFRYHAEAGYGVSFDQAEDLEEWTRFQSIQRNLMEMAALKQNALAADLRRYLLDVDGNKLSKKEWEEKIVNTLSRHNSFYFKTELDATFKASGSLFLWHNIIENVELYPNLRYETVGDDLVREEHALLDGAVYPVFDDFWDEWFPPAGWGCRCVVVQTDEDENRIVPDKTVDKGFRHNPGKTGKLFDESHPYWGIKKETKDDLIHQAENEWRKLARDEAKEFAAENLVGKDLPVTALETEIVLSNRNVNGVLSRFAQFEPERNNLFFIMGQALEAAELHSQIPFNKDTPHILRSFLLKLKAKHLNFFFEIRELLDGKEKTMVLHSISDKP